MTSTEPRHNDGDPQEASTIGNGTGSHQVEHGAQQATEALGAKTQWSPSLAYFAWWLFISILLVAVKIAFERSRFGPPAEQWTYAMLTSVLPTSRPDGLGIVVIDIGRLSGGSVDSATLNWIPTPRTELQQFIGKLVKLQVRAIGIDIDFSPTQNGWVDDGDPQFLRYCLRLNKTTPIVLGVFRSLREPRDAWLGLPEFAPLAGGLWLPEDGLERTPVWTRSPGVADKLPSLGAALASRGLRSRIDDQAGSARWLQFIRQREVSRPPSDVLIVGEMLTNHSVVQQISDQHITADNATNLERLRNKIEGRIVLLGVVESAPDLFRVPGVKNDVAGVLIHAANTYSMAMEPILEFSHGVRLSLDLALSGLLLLATILLKRRRTKRNSLDIERSEAHTLWCLVAATLVFSAAAVVFFRILWLDFILVVFLLALHKRVEILVHRFWHQLRTHADPLS
jgi:CHASE2 domain-containing sensor protein